MTEKLKLDGITCVLEDFRRGEMVIMVDDEARENEGDLLVAAQCVTAEHINFMAQHGRGLICLTLSEARCAQLELPLMVSRNNARFATNFTVSIEAAHGVTTGISAHDRAKTVAAAVQPNAKPQDIVSPGHIFPIKAQPGGVLTRAGHTEAGSDLARLCGFEPASVICEILKPDGSMARLPDLVEFSRRHAIRIGSIAELIRYRLKNDPTVVRVSESKLRLQQGEFRAFVYRDTMEGGVHLALVRGQITPDKPTPVRVHVHRGLLDVVLQPDSPWSWQLGSVLDTIAAVENGVVIVLSYNQSDAEISRQIGLGAAAKPTQATKPAAADAAHPDNLRMLGAGGQILADLKVRKVLALRREKRAHGLSGFGVEIVSYVADPQGLTAELAKWQ